MVRLLDGPDGAHLRREQLPAHLEFIEANLDTLFVAGPLLSEAGGEMCGSLYVIDVDDTRAAKRFLERDPYWQAGLWAEVEMLPFRAVAGRWVGGRSW